MTDTEGLTFRVSRNEETVLLELQSGATSTQVESRSNHYLLLHLARQRLKDAALPLDEQGWIDRAELARALAVGPEHLNVQMFRLRRSLSEKGILDVGNLLQTRGRPSQVRIGVADLHILPLG